MKSMIWIGVGVGGTIGSMIPSLWGADAFSLSSIWLGGLGSIIGIWVGYKLAHW